MSWLKKILGGGGGLEITRPWDTRAERRNHHCGSEKCSKPHGCLCVCGRCVSEWQKENSAASKMFDEHREEYILARQVMNSRRPREALLAQRGPGSPEPDSVDWAMVMGQLAGMNTSYNAECKVMAGRYHAMARETTSADDAIRYWKEAELWEQGGPLADEGDALKRETADSFPREAGYPSEDDEAFAKEAAELLLRAGYPDDLNRYFKVLRQKGLSVELAATCVDDSRGMFERWEFSGGSSGREPINLIVRFWHDTRNLDWQGILYSGKEIKEQASGQTLEQLEIQLELWTDR